MAEELPEWAVGGVSAGEPEAFAVCYEHLADPLYRYLLASGATAHLAEDLVEDTFVELVVQRPRLRGGVSGLRAWLFRAARNNLLDARRKQIRRGDRPLSGDLGAGQVEPTPGPEERALEQADARRMRELLGQLSPDQREVLVLRFVADLSGPEIAAATGRTVGAVKALQHRGVAALARILEQP